MKKISIIIFILICCMLVGCSKMIPQAKYDSSYNEGFVSDEINYSTDKQSDNTQPNLTIDRKIIKDASLTVESTDYDNFIATINNSVNNLNGYIQSNNEYNKPKNLRSADIKIRIPAENFDTFLNMLGDVCNILNKNINVSDITETYVDIEAKLSSLRTEYDTLLKLLEQADNLDDIIRIQDRLSNARYEIESYEARKRVYDNQIEYSTISLHISEVEKETVIEKESFGNEISRRFKESLEEVGDGFKNFAVWFIGNLPHILTVIVLLVGLPIIIIVIIVKSIKKKKLKK